MNQAPELLRIHHAAIICSDYQQSRHFYTEVLGLQVVAENYRTARDSWKLDLRLPDGGQIELFSMPTAPMRPSYPEALGLRHIAFAVPNLEDWRARLTGFDIPMEEIRVDEYTGHRFMFFADPDQLPIELYEVS
jgi:glyoxylase I family protein